LSLEQLLVSTLGLVEGGKGRGEPVVSLLPCRLELTDLGHAVAERLLLHKHVDGAGPREPPVVEPLIGRRLVAAGLPHGECGGHESQHGPDDRSRFAVRLWH
jgi:hypothetical protein